MDFLCHFIGGTGDVIETKTISSGQAAHATASSRVSAALKPEVKAFEVWQGTKMLHREEVGRAQHGPTARHAA